MIANNNILKKRWWILKKIYFWFYFFCSIKFLIKFLWMFWLYNTVITVINQSFSQLDIFLFFFLLLAPLILFRFVFLRLVEIDLSDLVFYSIFIFDLLYTILVLELFYVLLCTYCTYVAIEVAVKQEYLHCTSVLQLIVQNKSIACTCVL